MGFAADQNNSSLIICSLGLNYCFNMATITHFILRNLQNKSKNII